MKTYVWILTMSSIILPTETKSCASDVCFNWKVSDRKLTLVCKLQNILFKVDIKDPKGNIQANCLPPSPSKKIRCNAVYENGTIRLNQKTNQITFIVRGNINKQMNGNWTCQHGSNRDTALVEVTVFEYKGSKVIKEPPLGHHCIVAILCISALSFIFAVSLALVLMSFISCKPTFIDDCFKKTETNFCEERKDKHQYITRVKKCGFAVSTLMFFSVVCLIGFFDSEKCSTKWFFVFFGLIAGCLFSLMFLNKDSEEKEVELNVSLQELGEQAVDLMKNEDT